MLKLYSNIKTRRMMLGMTQTQLAEKMGYADKGMISKIEKGKVDLPYSKILQFADVLKVHPAELMGWKDRNDSNEEVTDKNIEEYHFDGDKFIALDAGELAESLINHLTKFYKIKAQKDVESLLIPTTKYPNIYSRAKKKMEAVDPELEKIMLEMLSEEDNVEKTG